MRLEDLIPREKDLLDFSVEQVADQVLICLVATGKALITRKGLASRLVRGYPSEFGKDSLLAIEEAIMYLEHHMFIGVDPDERERVFITRAGKVRSKNAQEVLLTAAL
jgi:hypothetical protein